MRMVVSLADLDKSRWVNLTGVSGHAFDPHYVDQTKLWVDGETLPWVAGREGGRGRHRPDPDVAAYLRRRRLTPAGVATAVTGRSWVAAGTASSSSSA